MKLRGLSGLVTNRISSEIVTLKYPVYDEYGDGSETVTYDDIDRKASVGALQPKDIERLEKAGIIVKNGVTIVISVAPETQPDMIVHGFKTYRVVSWAFDHEFDEYDEYDEYTSKYGTVVATCDLITVAGI